MTAVRSSRSNTFLLLKSLWIGFVLITVFFVNCYKDSFKLPDLKPWKFVPVCNGRFGPLSLVAGNVFMEVGQPTRHCLCDVTQLIPSYSVTLQMVRQWALPARKRKYTFNNRHKFHHTIRGAEYSPWVTDLYRSVWIMFLFSPSCIISNLLSRELLLLKIQKRISSAKQFLIKHIGCLSMVPTCTFYQCS